MKRIGVVASLVLLASAIAVTGAYAAAPGAVTDMVTAAWGAACDWCPF